MAGGGGGGSGGGRELPLESALSPEPETASYDAWVQAAGQPDFAAGMRQAWVFGEEGAERVLAEFLHEGLFTYAKKFTRADDKARPSSHLAPYLAAGDISPNMVFAAVSRHIWTLPTEEQRQDSTLWRRINRSLRFREWWWYNLYHWPRTPSHNIRTLYDALPWRTSPSDLRAWQRGCTGYPLIDAGMRELWVTGYMHHFVRMAVASFLCKDLLLHWKEGQAWFWDTLCDADLAINAAYWQNMGSSGVEQMRWFDPVACARWIDPTGAYVRKWVPELRHLPNKTLFCPWKDARRGVGRGVGGKTRGCKAVHAYPAPIVPPGQGLLRYRAALFTLPDQTARTFEDFGGIPSGVDTASDTSVPDAPPTPGAGAKHKPGAATQAPHPQTAVGLGGRAVVFQGDGTKLGRTSEAHRKVSRARKQAKDREAALPQHILMNDELTKHGLGGGERGSIVRREMVMREQQKLY